MTSPFDDDPTYLQALQILMRSVTKPASFDDALKPIRDMLQPGSSGRAKAIDWLGDEFLADSTGAPRDLFQELEGKIASFRNKLDKKYLLQPVHVGLPRSQQKVVKGLAKYDTNYAVAIFVWTLQDPPVYVLVQRIAADVKGRATLLEATVLPFALYFASALHALPDEFKIKDGVVRRAMSQAILTKTGIEVSAALRYTKDEHHYKYLFLAASKFDYAKIPESFLELSNPEQPGTVFEIEATPECPAYDIEAFSDFTGTESEGEVVFEMLSYWHIKEDVQRQRKTIHGIDCKPEVVQVKGVGAPVCEFCGLKVHKDRPYLHYADVGCLKAPDAQDALKKAMDNEDVDTILKLFAANVGQTDSSGTSLVVFAMAHDHRELLQKLIQAGAKPDPEDIVQELREKRLQRIGLCETHPELKVQAWCNTCNQPICVRCMGLRGGHTEHKFDAELKECFLGHKDDFAKSLKQADDGVASLEQCRTDASNSCRIIEEESASARSAVDDSLATQDQAFVAQKTKDENEIAKLQIRIQELEAGIKEREQRRRTSCEKGKEVKTKLGDGVRKHCDAIDVWNRGVQAKAHSAGELVSKWKKAFEDGETDDLVALDALRARQKTGEFLADTEKLQAPTLPNAVSESTAEAQAARKEFEEFVDAGMTEHAQDGKKKTKAFLAQQIQQLQEFHPKFQEFHLLTIDPAPGAQASPAAKPAASSGATPQAKAAAPAAAPAAPPMSADGALPKATPQAKAAAPAASPAAPPVPAYGALPGAKLQVKAAAPVASPAG